MSFSRFIGNSGGMSAGDVSWETNPNVDPDAVPAPTVSGDWTGDLSDFNEGDPVQYTFTVCDEGISGGGAATGVLFLDVSFDGNDEYAAIDIPSNYKSGDIIEGPDGIRLSLDTDALEVDNNFTVNINAGDSDDLDDSDCWSEMTTTKEDLTNNHFTFNANFLGANDTNMRVELDLGATCNEEKWNPDSLSTTQFASASTTVFQSSSGFGAGDLQSVSVDVDGVITGQYSNGQVTPLFRVGLAKFQNVQGLYKEGGSLFKETRTSGAAITGKPGANGLGSIAPNSLEQSNVDIANEFVKMITTQRGFQANSKIITTIDSMLGDTINLKR